MMSKKHLHRILIVIAILILMISIAFSAYLLVFNYKNVHLFRKAERNFLSNTPASLNVAESQLLQLIRNDPDNEQAFLMLSRIAERRKKYPEQVYYSYQAHKLNPLSRENEELYILSLLRTREFLRLENFLALKQDNDGTLPDLLLYAAARNGNLGKYRERREPAIAGEQPSSPLQELLRILYLDTSLDSSQKLQALGKLKNTLSQEEFFLRQEIAEAETRLYLEQQKLEEAEAALLDAYHINAFAFAPPLGRFYANYRSIGKALEILEQYLADYHDPLTAMQAAEFCCLLKKRDKITALREEYQTDSGELALLCTYYLDALNAFAADDIDAAKPYLAPLKQAIRTPLATFLYLCVELRDRNYSGVAEYYNALLNHPPYLGLQEQADQMVLDVLQHTIRETPQSAHPEELPAMAEKLNTRTPNAFLMKYILLKKRHDGTFDANQLQEAMERYPADSGVWKIAIEYYLGKDPALAERQIAAFKKTFPAQAGDMLRYKIIASIRNQQPDRASELFQKHFTPDLRPMYWEFAMTGSRQKDLEYLAQDPLYQPFCEAALLLAAGKKNEALDLLVQADAQGDLPLLFFAARTLGENGRPREALEKYSRFPADSNYQTAVLMNRAELHVELGDLPEALRLAQEAYLREPDLPEAQYCYADKLYRSARSAEIVNVVKLSGNSAFSRELKTLWILGMEERLRLADAEGRTERLRELCDQLLAGDPQNQTAQEYRKKVNQHKSNSTADQTP